MITTTIALRSTCIEAIRDSETVAAAADVDSAEWADEDRPRVVSAGTIGAVNRGRMPMVTVGIGAQSYDGATSDQGGMVTTEIIVGCFVAGRESEGARAQAETMLAASLAAIRATHHAAPGPDTVSVERRGVGVVLAAARLDVECSYGNDYEVEVDDDEDEGEEDP